jgi:fructose-bisphosphate aldolase, class I
VDIHCPKKSEAETLLKQAILEKLNGLDAARKVMLKLTIPDQNDLYDELIHHPRVLKVVVLSGGYSRDEANARLRHQHGVVASFSRALVEGVSAQQSAQEFDDLMDSAIQSIYEASVIKNGA